ncbi:MAG: efflux RND transporter periplasmic adaptor subunit [candidate division Zixibacteria bacterium]|nr:efflux RND transporter periplasmic adaptor subunit [candidate division Zixibacteria bacterium]MDH3937364.1 efflux RND transporter periplasmic adaptor subunit [candidate division Zixibacteria bacterium]MDH4034518.1 efflux RND transporter periplasmic adaptor subunit [candidate division Zixibacteria bacterium]
MSISRLLALFVLSVAICVGSSGCGGEDESGPPLIRPVRYEQVFATGGTRVREFSGASRAGVESRLSFKVAGTIRELSVRVGEEVKAGSLIARLDSEDYQLQVQSADASLSQAKAQARKAAANHDRVRAGYENRSSSLNDFDAARAANESARAAVLAAQKNLELAQRRMEYTRLTAPVAGAIAAVECEVNENVKVGQVVALLTSGSDLEVEVAVPEILISQVREGQQATVTFDALADRPCRSIVTEVGVASTGMVTTFPVIVVLEEIPAEVRPGMAAQVALTFESRDQRERYVVPSVAVGEDGKGRFVYVVAASDPGFGLVRRRPVTVGELTADGIELFEGLADGDLVVTAGVSKLVDGMTVRLAAPEGNPL